MTAPRPSRPAGRARPPLKQPAGPVLRPFRFVWSQLGKAWRAVLRYPPLVVFHSLVFFWRPAQVRHHAMTKPRNVVHVSLTEGIWLWCLVELRDGRCCACACGTNALALHDDLLIKAMAAGAHAHTPGLPKAERVDNPGKTRRALPRQDTRASSNAS